MPHQESVTQLKQAIKVWEHEFQGSNNRIPSRSDIKLDAKIYKLYKTYKILKSKSNNVDNITENNTTKDTRNIGIDINILESQSDVEGIEDFSNNTESNNSQLKNKDTELGPTPQANGKVLSILDMRLTPPDSSPLKNKLGTKTTDTEVMQTEATQEDMFKTPTKSRVNRIDFLQLTPRNNTESRNKSLTQKLEQIAYVKNISVEDQIRTPGKNKEPLLNTMETPQYLAKINNKFNFDMDNELSAKDKAISETVPLMSPSRTSSIARSTILDPVTPTKLVASNFQVSPSPLKPHRLFSFGNNKKLSEIFNDYKNINVDSDLIDDIENVDENTELQAGGDNTNTAISTSGPKRKKTTQKRTTRRWKIKPHIEESKEDTLKNVNIHDEVKRLNEEAHNNLVDYMETDGNVEEEESDSEEEYVHQDPNDKKLKGKVKHVRMNYQRLKINDPRIKKFKKRMQNRR